MSSFCLKNNCLKNCQILRYMYTILDYSNFPTLNMHTDMLFGPEAVMYIVNKGTSIFADL